MELDIDKSEWQTVKLSDAVTKKEENDRENAKNRFRRFLKVGHFDPQTLHVKRWGDQNEEELPPTFYKVFRKGQILFPTRNPHLRRTVLAPFDGICGEKTLTLEANEGIANPEFIPFLFNSENFVAYTTSSIIGSTNPHVRWRDVANYEFLLPPKDQQAKLAELLWAADEVVEREMDLREQLLEAKKVVCNKWLLGKDVNGSKKKSPYGQIPDSWSLVSLFDLRDKRERYSFTGGPFGSNLKSEHYTESGVRILQLQNIGDGEFLNDYKIYTSIERADILKSCNIYPNEIILAKMSPVARCCLIPNEDNRYVMCSDGIRLKVNEELYVNKFIYHSLNTDHFKRYAESKSTGSTRSRIGLRDLKQIPIPVPSKIKDQEEIVFKIDLIDQNIENTKNKIFTSKALQKSLINQIF